MHKKILNDEVYECYFLKEQNDFFYYHPTHQLF